MDFKQYCHLIQTATRCVVEHTHNLTPMGIKMSIPTLQQVEDMVMAKYIVDKEMNDKLINKEGSKKEVKSGN